MKQKTKDRSDTKRGKPDSSRTGMAPREDAQKSKQLALRPTPYTQPGRHQPAEKQAENNLLEIADQNIYAHIQTVRTGVPFLRFQEWAEKMSFTPAEWAAYLHLSERTLQRYKKEEATFDALQSEKILEILLLVKKGIEVFEDKENFTAWLEASNVALGHVKPKDLLDSSFGINLLREELIRIEQGVLA